MAQTQSHCAALDTAGHGRAGLADRRGGRSALVHLARLHAAAAVAMISCGDLWPAPA